MKDFQVQRKDYALVLMELTLNAQKSGVLRMGFHTKPTFLCILPRMFALYVVFPGAEYNESLSAYCSWNRRTFGPGICFLEDEN